MLTQILGFYVHMVPNNFFTFFDCEHTTLITTNFHFLLLFIEVKSGNFSLRICHEAPFLQIGSVSVREIIKNVLFLQVFWPAPPTPPLFRVVLLHTQLKVKRLFVSLIFEQSLVS